MNKKYLFIAFLIGFAASLSAVPSSKGLLNRADEAKENASKKAEEAEENTSKKAEKAQEKATKKADEAKAKAEDATEVEETEE